MNDRYFFDKRDWKRRFLKYGIIFGISFVPIVLINVLCSDYISRRWLIIFLDSSILLGFVAIGNSIANRIFEKKDKKLERIQKEREELNARKKKIMEDSYHKIRLEKERKKKEKLQDNITIEVKESLVVKNNTSKITKSKSNASINVKTENKLGNKKAEEKVEEILAENNNQNLETNTISKKASSNLNKNKTTKKTNENKSKGNS